MCVFSSAAVLVWSKTPVNRLRANHDFVRRFKLIRVVQSLALKYFTSVFQKYMLPSQPSRTHQRGASRSSRTLGAGCGGRVGAERRAAFDPPSPRLRRDWYQACRAAFAKDVTRTAKSCGPGTPRLVPSWRRCLRIVPMTVTRTPGHRGERGANR